MPKKNSQSTKVAKILTDDELEQLAKLAFANMDDFVRFEPDGRVEIYDWEKAREAGARISVTTRKVGRGENAREIRSTQISLPDKARALFKLYKHVVEPLHKRP